MLFAALADPTRRRILELLAERERSVGQLVDQFEVSQPAISRHLRVLRETGWVRCTDEGRRRIYRFDPGALRELDDWAERRRRAWSRRLDALEAHLEDSRRREPEEEDG
jgi:DNA-binding transcriptional ArsR family regulator